MSAAYKDKVTIITGASSGIGYATARKFAARGACIVAVARREELLQRLVEECHSTSPRSSYLCGDLGEREFAERVIADTISQYGRLDILINNAAITQHKQIYDVTAEEVDSLMRVNFMSCVWLTLAALPHFLAQDGGAIVNISSFAAKVAPPRETVYAASKAAMNAFSEGLWNDLAGSNIHVSLINPGPIDTEIWSKHETSTGYRGYKYPPDVVVDAIFAAIERHQFEATIPRREPRLVLARALRLFLPSVLRYGMARAFPIPSDVVAAARANARQRIKR